MSGVAEIKINNEGHSNPTNNQLKNLVNPFSVSSFSSSAVAADHVVLDKYGCSKLSRCINSHQQIKKRFGDHPFDHALNFWSHLTPNQVGLRYFNQEVCNLYVVCLKS